MIGRLRGILVEKQLPQLLIDVNGVSYELQVPIRTYEKLPPVDGTLTLHTHLVSSDSGQSLYGFSQPRERRLFRALIKVNGVGPKMALAILSCFDADEFIALIQAQELTRLVKVPGIGRKTAERLLLDLRDRLKDMDAARPVMASSPGGGGAAERDEAQSALVALGYKPAQAAQLIARAAEQAADVSDSEALIRLALRSAVPA